MKTIVQKMYLYVDLNDDFDNVLCKSFDSDVECRLCGVLDVARKCKTKFGSQWEHS